MIQIGLRNIKWAAGMLLAFSAVFASCSDDEMTSGEGGLFRPVADASTSTSEGRPLIYVEWTNEIPNSDGYALELYRDSLGPEDTEFTPVATGTTNVREYTFGLAGKEDLAWDTEYYVRIKAVNQASGVESKFYVCKPVTTDDYPTQLKAVAGSEIIDNAAIIRWTPGADVYTTLDITQLSVEKKDSVIKRIDLSGIQDNMMKVYGLEAETEYKAKIYVGERPADPSDGISFEPMPDAGYRGKKVFTTKAPQDFGDQPVVDLTTLSDAEALEYITSDFVAGLEDNTVVVLKGGCTYNINGVALGKSIKFIPKYSLDGYANLAVKANFTIPNGSAIENIVFENINLYTPGATPETSNYGGGYLFNLDKACTVGNIIFRGCDIQFFRGGIRTKSAGPDIQNYILENCKLSYIGGYCVACVDADNSAIHNLTMVACTLAYVEQIAKVTKAKGVMETMTMTSCTSCFTPKSNAMFDFGSASACPKSTITKSIFAKAMKNPATAWKGADAPSVTDCFTTSDFTCGDSDLFYANVSSSNKLTEDYTGIFADPDNLDFTLTYSKLKGFGDPRW